MNLKLFCNQYSNYCDELNSSYFVENSYDLKYFDVLQNFKLLQNVLFGISVWSEIGYGL